MRLKGADMVMECLLEQGVDIVFGYPGGQYLKYMIVYINIRIKYSQYLHHMNKGHLMLQMDMQELLEK